MVETEIRGQAEQPGAERRLAPVEGELPVRRQEDVLEDVLGMLAAHHADDQRKEPPRVRPVELFECSWSVSFAASGQRKIRMDVHAQLRG
jgi:hypothetical protein